MSKLVQIAQALRDKGLTVGLDTQDNEEVTVSDTEFSISITEEAGFITATLYAGNYANAWTHEEELFTYRNPNAVVSAVAKKVEHLQSVGE